MRVISFAGDTEQKNRIGRITCYKRATRELHKNSNRSLTLNGKVEKSKLGIESKNRYKILLADAYALEYFYMSKQDFKYLILQLLSLINGLQNVLITVVLAEHWFFCIPLNIHLRPSDLIHEAVYHKNDMLLAIQNQIFDLAFLFFLFSTRLKREKILCKIDWYILI